MAIELFNHNGHVCLMFAHLSDEGGEAVQANQFLVIHGDTGAIIDPGGNVAYNELLLTVGRFFSPQKLSMILASHADPDIIASLDRWMTSTQATLYISTLWERFAPHFCKPGKTVGRIKGIADPGMRIPLGNSEIVAIPAHFMHSEGNFQFWDPVSRILFSGDLGVSIGTSADASKPITSLAEHIPKMAAFHRRYMVSNKVLRLWANMARTLPIHMIVPQHGAPMAGPAVKEFIDWIGTVDCGVDNLSQANYTVPQ
ncbi:MAG: MBL fold metallo-hydrolase [Hydrogenophaga sp.]|uniref:MBL fold metallo-hydrolase n=1 Tax=Hydrogenophaga sp. TaxID=1904254 RepID=UPI00275769A0|nr:MBL fold metallo-hydrolase [Hydrogenophaga sp.]MDP2416864.1 MBL fold metallo-hydrolase [Hydrogenophaga sp.]MDZ4188839.1 MBL fold metallo-hydrolase [Hydrogenophaga sp.]